MNLPSNLFPHLLLWLADAFYVASLGVAIYLAPWKRLRERRLLNVYLGSCVMLLLIWTMNAGIRPGLSFHLLGSTLFVLMYGWELAYVGLSVVVFGSILDGASDWSSYALNALVMGALPVFISYMVYRWSIRRLPHHFFVYVLVNGYCCAWLAMALTILVSSSLMAVSGAYPIYRIVHDYLPFTPFIAFAEAFMTGMLATGMALTKPHWLSTFDDRRYLIGK